MSVSREPIQAHFLFQNGAAALFLFSTERQKALAVNLAGLVDGHKSMLVHGLCKIFELGGLIRRHGGKNDKFIRIRKRALRIPYRRGTVKRFRNKFCDFVRRRRDNNEALAAVQAIHHGLHKIRFDEHSDYGAKSGFGVEHKERRGDNESVRNQHTHADIGARIFAKDKRDDIRAAGASAALEHQCGADCAEHARKNQFQHNLFRKRSRHRTQPFKQIDRTGIKQRTICRFPAHATPQKGKTNDKGKKVKHRDKGRGIDAGDKLSEQDGKTAETSRRKTVRNLKEINAGRRQHRARRQNKKFRYPIFVEPFAVFFHFIRPFGYAHFHFKDTALLFFSI